MCLRQAGEKHLCGGGASLKPWKQSPGRPRCDCTQVHGKDSLCSGQVAGCVPSGFSMSRPHHAAFTHLFSLQVLTEHLPCAKIFLVGSNGSPSVVRRPAAAAPGNLRERQIFLVTPQTYCIRKSRSGPSQCYFSRASGRFWYMLTSAGHGCSMAQDDSHG